MKHDYQGSVWVRDISKGVENDYRGSAMLKHLNGYKGDCKVGDKDKSNEAVTATVRWTSAKGWARLQQGRATWTAGPGYLDRRAGLPGPRGRATWTAGPGYLDRGDGHLDRKAGLPGPPKFQSVNFILLHKLNNF